jgi:hypothetical protein
VPSIGVNCRLGLFKSFVTVRLTIKAVGHQSTRPTASLATVPAGDLGCTARKELTIDSESHPMSAEHLKAASIVPKGQMTQRRKCECLLGIRQGRTIGSLFVVCETEPREQPMTIRLLFKLGPD